MKRVGELLAQRMSFGTRKKEEGRKNEKGELGDERACRRAVYKFGRPTADNGIPLAITVN